MTPEEYESATLAALHEYERACRVVFYAVNAWMSGHGRESLPPMIVAAVDVAQDARESWLAKVDARQPEQGPPPVGTRVEHDVHGPGTIAAARTEFGQWLVRFDARPAEQAWCYPRRLTVIP